MPKYNQKISVDSHYSSEAKKFLEFLKTVGKQKTLNVRIMFVHLGKGKFYLSTEDKSNSIDLLIQDILLNKGLYYFACSLENKKDVIANVILPILQQITTARFTNPQARFLRNHIMGKHAQSDFIPSDLKNTFGYKFEIMYRKWQLKIVSDKDYLIDLDTLLHHYLLNALNHKEGQRSQEFQKLIEKLDLPFMFYSDFKEAFLKVHALRTGSLHRLQSLKEEDNLDYISSVIYNYFQFIDEYKEAQNEKFYTIKGKKYKRLKYGDDGWNDTDHSDRTGKNKIDWEEFTEKNPCHDCFVKKGHYHIPGCDMERCPNCSWQLISCDCNWDFYNEENKE